MDAVRPIELRAIFSGVEVGPDAEVALRDSFDLDRERLRLPALPLCRPFRCYLCADNQDRYAEQQRVLEPPRLELGADELSNSDVEQFVEAKAERAEREQCRRSAEVVGDRLSAGEFAVPLHVDEHALRSGQAWIFRDYDCKRIMQTAAGYARYMLV